MFIESQDFRIRKNIKGHLFWPFLIPLSRIIPPGGFWFLFEHLQWHRIHSLSGQPTAPLHGFASLQVLPYTELKSFFLGLYILDQILTLEKYKLSIIPFSQNTSSNIWRQQQSCPPPSGSYFQKSITHIHQAWLRPVPFLLLITLPFRNGLDGRKGE